MAGYNKRIRALEREVEKIAAHLGLSAPPADVNTPVQEVSTPPLKDWVVPLEHPILTREEVAERCIAAAQLKGYKRDKSKYWGEYIEGKLFFWANDRGDGCGFYTHDCQVEQSIEITTLEAFEAYCGVEQKKTRLDWLKELPDGYRERALANCKGWSIYQPSDTCKNMPNAIFGMSDWDETPEKRLFWRAVWNHYAEGTPLPDLPVQKPETYEAGFWWNNVCNLILPDKSNLYFGVSDKTWQKSSRKYPKASKPHTLTLVNQHTVGRFYLIEGEDPNDYESYALCVAEGKFVQPTMSNGVVEVLVVDEIFPNQVSLKEVTPAP